MSLFFKEEISRKTKQSIVFFNNQAQQMCSFFSLYCNSLQAQHPSSSIPMYK